MSTQHRELVHPEFTEGNVLLQAALERARRQVARAKPALLEVQARAPGCLTRNILYHCLCMCASVCMRVCVHVSVCARACARVRACVCARAYMCVCARARVHVCVCARGCMCVRARRFPLLVRPPQATTAGRMVGVGARCCHNHCGQCDPCFRSVVGFSSLQPKRSCCKSTRGFQLHNCNKWIQEKSRSR